MVKRETEKFKGIFQPGKPFAEKKNIAIPVSFPERRSVRYRCARIKNRNWEENDGLREIIESQFEKDMNWDNFMKVWDISHKNPLKVIRK